MAIESLEQLLRRLAGTSDVTQRLSVLVELVEWWHAPVAADAVMPPEDLAGAELPMPLRWWYGRFGRRTNILSGQNWFLGPDDLRLEEDDDAGAGDPRRLVFWQENQAV